MSGAPSIAGWTFRTDEVSMGVYRVRGIDVAGRSVEATGTDPEALLEDCKRTAARLMDPRENVPTVINTMRVVLYSRIDARHRPTGGCRHIKHGDVLGPAWGVAICTDLEDTKGFFVFSCEDDWMPAADTWHATLEDAKHQAEFEYTGLAATWETPPR